MLCDSFAMLVLPLAYFADCPSPFHTELSPFGAAPPWLGDGPSRFHAAPARFDTGPVELDKSSTPRHPTTENGGAVQDGSTFRSWLRIIFQAEKETSSKWLVLLRADYTEHEVISWEVSPNTLFIRRCICQVSN